MRTLLHLVLAGAIVGGMIASPIVYKRYHDIHYRNFHVVESGILYRSGQLPLARLQELVIGHGIRTVISLRDGTDPVDQQEESWVNGKALKFVRIQPRGWSLDETGKVPSEINVQTFREIMDTPANHPVLVHCFAGNHRTGLMCAIYRMDYQGWTNDEAMAEMRTMGYSLLDDHEDVQGFLTSYRPCGKVCLTRQP